jgi:hypothetical protein
MFADWLESAVARRNRPNSYHSQNSILHLKEMRIFSSEGYHDPKENNCWILPGIYFISDARERPKLKTQYTRPVAKMPPRRPLYWKAAAAGATISLTKPTPPKWIL